MFSREDVVTSTIELFFLLFFSCFAGCTPKFQDSSLRLVERRSRDAGGVRLHRAPHGHLQPGRRPPDRGTGRRAKVATRGRVDVPGTTRSTATPSSQLLRWIMFGSTPLHVRRNNQAHSGRAWAVLSEHRRRRQQQYRRKYLTPRFPCIPLLSYSR